MDIQNLLVNGRRYRKPCVPTVVICVDGWDPAYLRAGLKACELHFLGSLQWRGFIAQASAVMPTFTNPNNASIVTGVSPAEHGIQGNYLYDRESGREVMVNSGAFLRTPTILASLEHAGVRVGIVTAKDKLRSIIGAELRGLKLSAESANLEAIIDPQLRERIGELGAPDKYSAELSYYALEAALHIMRAGAADLLYVSLSDYVQHKSAPGEAAATDFFRHLDEAVKELTHLGVLVGLTADHGMRDKCGVTGKPNVLYLESELSVRCGAGNFKVICPITDPYVRHHGALGSFARVYALTPDANLIAAREHLARLRGIEAVLERQTAADDLDLPFDLEADLVVLAAHDFVLGSTPANHDLSALGKERLRSHGGASELVVPFLINAPITDEYALRATRRGLRNFDMFDYVLNGAEVSKVAQ
jgi:phosphonoacetate hydrolase